MSTPRSPRILAALVLATACEPVRYTEVFTPDEPVERVVLDLDRGAVTLVPAEALAVERTIRGAEGAAILSHNVGADGTLRIEGRCPGLWPCAVDTKLSLPADLPVSVVLGSGEVRATEIADLQVDVASGDVDVDVGRRLVASVGSGGVRAWLGAEADARVTVGQGDVEVVLPPGPYALDLSAREEAVRGVTPDPAAPGRLQVVAPAGRVSVRGGQRVARR